MSRVLTPLLEDLEGLDVRWDEPMAAHTTLRVGGPAAAFVRVRTAAALGTLLDRLVGAEVPWLVLGNGSNVLFADAGFDGVVVALGEGFRRAELQRDHHGPGRHRLEVGGALSITRLLRLARREALDGPERLGGVPATVGGAVRMNAGTRLGQLSDVLEAAQIVRPDEAPAWWPTEALRPRYRATSLPPDAVVCAARLACGDADADTRARYDEVLGHRRDTQPLQTPSCGSVFANPPGDAAGRLVEACGLKGRRVGGAMIAEAHANWILNVDGARAADVQALIDLAADEVRRQHGIALQREVRLAGDWGNEAPATPASDENPTPRVPDTGASDEEVAS